MRFITHIWERGGHRILRSEDRWNTIETASPAAGAIDLLDILEGSVYMNNFLIKIKNLPRG